MRGSASNARQAQRLRAICQAFFEECRLAEDDAERGRNEPLATGSGEGRTTVDDIEAGTGTGRGVSVRSRLHKCAGFVAVLSLLLQPSEEWERNKRLLLVSGGRQQRGGFCQ